MILMKNHPHKSFISINSSICNDITCDTFYTDVSSSIWKKIIIQLTKILTDFIF